MGGFKIRDSGFRKREDDREFEMGMFLTREALRFTTEKVGFDGFQGRSPGLFA